MPLLADAWASVKRNQGEVLFYLASLCIFSMLDGGLMVGLGVTPENKPPWLPAYQFGHDLFAALLFSAIVPIVFARMGEDIDRPLWRCPSDREAIQRFFVPWLILHLVVFTLFRLTARAAEAQQESLTGFLLLLATVASMSVIPTGACIMYHGRFRWSELGIALRPLVERLDLFMLVAMLLIIQFFGWVVADALGMPPQELAKAELWQQVKSQVLYDPMVTIPLNLLDCVIFAMVWRICMIHRDEELDESDPFDF